MGSGMTKPNTQATTQKDIKFPINFTKLRHPAVWVAGLIVLVLVLRSWFSGDFGQLGPDNDDAMRLVQIRDFLGGQSWFHTDQYRLGLTDGTDMHWSRIADIPVILLTKLFDVFLPQEIALQWAYTVWPLMTAGGFILIMAKAAKFWGGPKTFGFALALLGFFAFQFQRFKPGSIDHHNIQMVLIAIAMGFALDPKMRGRSFAISGFAAAVSVAIGVDVYIFAAIISIFIAVNWAIYGTTACRAAQGYGLAMAGGLALAFLGTVAPSEYGLVYCDALSLITVCAGAAGALGLAVAASFLSEKPRLWRFAGLGLIGIICLMILGLQAPQCLANPLDALPADIVENWLSDVQEAQPLFSPQMGLLTDVPYMIGATATGLILLVFGLLKDRRWSPKYLILMLLIAAIGLTLYQVRFHAFAYVFAILPLAAWIGSAFAKSRASGERSVLYLGCLALSIPIIWAAPGALLTDKAENTAKTKRKEQSGHCYSKEVIVQLNALETGVISAGTNGAGDILTQTKHRTLSGNYHRNWRGIATQIQIASSVPEKAYDLLIEHGVDYIHYCKWDAETGGYVKNAKDGLIANVSAGRPPAYLKPVSNNLEGGDVQIFRVVR